MSFSCKNAIKTLSVVLKPHLGVRTPSKICAAMICSKERMDPNIKKPAPWPYERKKFRFYHWYLDSTAKRFDENTKFIIVDGNIGAGKTEFAKHIAETFGMKYIPEPDLTAKYITPYGYDLRLIDDVMPPSYKYCGIDTYYKDPYNMNVTGMQFKMLFERYLNYIDATTHLLNTGQGLVFDRCVFSDFVFIQAMCEAGYVRKEAVNYYFEIYQSMTEALLRPHLIIYLDITPETALKRIKERNKEMEVNSKVLTHKYLSDIEYFYKQRYLKKLGNHAELLIYDWNEYGDYEVVVEDIERLDFTNYDKYSEMMADFTDKDDWAWGWLRRTYTTNRNELIHYANLDRFEITECYHPIRETLEYNDLMEKVPGHQYQYGFNRKLGDKFLFKIQQYGEFHFKRTV